MSWQKEIEMSTLKDWIIEMADGEDVEAVALGEMGGWAGQRTDEPLNTILSWEQALPFLSYEFNDDFGEEKCNDLYVWTPSWIICIDFHDGFPSPYRIPRNPATWIEYRHSEALPRWSKTRWKNH